MDMDEALMRMIVNSHALSREMQEAQSHEEDLLAKAIEESLKEHPNPDMMNYEQLQELGDKIGHVSKGLTEQ